MTDDYQPSVIGRVITSMFLVATAFLLPFGIMKATPNSEFNPPLLPNTGGETPTPIDYRAGDTSILTFARDGEIDPSSSIGLSLPYESRWDFVSRNEEGTSYVYTDQTTGCTVEAMLTDFSYVGDSKTGSKNLLNEHIAINLSDADDVYLAEFSYNITSTIQTIGIGTVRLGVYKWVNGRAFTSLNKGFLVITSCSDEDSMHNASDSVRSQFGVLIQP